MPPKRNRRIAEENSGNSASPGHPHSGPTAAGSTASVPQETHSRIAINPPAFYRKSPELWFRQLESRFTLAGITNAETKFHHTLAALPEDVAGFIDLDTEDYTSLKASVLEALRANRHQRIEEALAAVELGDRRPSQLVTDIKRRFSEVGLQVDDSIIKSRLLTALPSHIRSALVGHEEVPLDAFAKIADSMLAVAGCATPFASINRTAAASQEHPRDSNSHFRGRNPDEARTYRNSRRRPKICNGHLYYAAESRTCRPWCKWPGPKPSTLLASRQPSPAQSRASSPTPSQASN